MKYYKHPCSAFGTATIPQALKKEVPYLQGQKFYVEKSGQDAIL